MCRIQMRHYWYSQGQQEARRLKGPFEPANNYAMIGFTVHYYTEATMSSKSVGAWSDYEYLGYGYHYAHDGVRQYEGCPSWYLFVIKIVPAVLTAWYKGILA